MEIQQHDGVVVEAAVISAGLRQAPMRERERGVTRGEGGGQGLGAAALPPPTIYRAPRGAPALDIGSQGGRRPRGVACSRSQVGRPPPLGFPTLGTGGGPWGAHQPTRGWFHSHFSPWGPLG